MLREGLALLGQLNGVLLPVGLHVGEVLHVRDVDVEVLEDLVLDMGSDPLGVTKHGPLIVTYSEGVEVGRVDLGELLPAVLAVQQHLQGPVGQPSLLLLAGQVTLEASKESIPGLLDGFLELVDLLKLLELPRVELRVARHPGSD